MRDMVATKTYPKFLAILTERRKRLLSCWQVVRIKVIFCSAHGLIFDCEAVQCRDLASIMRSALTTRNLANCASLILKTVSIIMVSVFLFALSVENWCSTGTLPLVYPGILWR